MASLTELNNGQIKLFSQITRLNTPKRVLASLTKEIDVEQIVYFAASIIWRGSVMTGGCKLGAYEPKFRQYLLGEEPFPREAIISVGMFEESPSFDASGWVSEPASIKAGLLWLHGFLMAGLVFRCFVGQATDQDLHKISLAGPNPDKYVPILKPEECEDFLAAAEMAGNAKPRGKLARVG